MCSEISVASALSITLCTVGFKTYLLGARVQSGSWSPQGPPMRAQQTASLPASDRTPAGMYFLQSTVLLHDAVTCDANVTQWLTGERKAHSPCVGNQHQNSDCVTEAPATQKHFSQTNLILLRAVQPCAVKMVADPQPSALGSRHRLPQQALVST